MPKQPTILTLEAVKKLQDGHNAALSMLGASAPEEAHEIGDLLFTCLYHMARNTPDLSLVTEMELLNELASRNTAMVACMLRPAKKANEANDILIDFRGGRIMSMGLLADAMAKMNHTAADSSRYVPESGSEDAP